MAGADGSRKRGGRALAEALRARGLWCELARAATVRSAAEWRGLGAGVAGWVLVLRGHLMGGDAPRALRFGPGHAVAVTGGGRIPGVVSARTSGDFHGLVLAFSPGLGGSQAKYLIQHYGPRVDFGPGTAVVRAGLALALRAKRRAAGLDVAEAVRAFEWLAQWHEHLEGRLARLRNGLAGAGSAPGRRALAAYSLKELAETTAWSRASLGRRLRQAGLAQPAAALRTERLRWAAERVSHGRETLPVIMTRVGYRSMTGFVAAFRREFGCSPGDLRREAAAGEAGAGAHPTETRGLEKRSRGRAPEWEADLLHAWAFGLSSVGTSRLPPASPFRLDLGAAVAKTTWLVTLAGAAELRYEQGTRVVRRGMAVCYPQPTAAEWRAVEGRGRWRRVWVQMHGEPAARFVAVVTAHGGDVQALDPAGRAVRAARGLGAGGGNSGGSWIRRSAAVYRWLMAWAAEVEQRGPGVRVGELGLAALPCAQANRRFKAYAEALGYSRSYLQQKLRGQWQAPPGQILRLTRLKAAAAELRTSRKAVAAIAGEAGYATAWGFTAAFKRQYGVTPLRFRHGVGPDTVVAEGR